MTLLISYITNTTIGKWLYGLVFTVSTYDLVKQSTMNETSFFEELLKNVPAQVVYVLGIIYGIAIVLTKISDLWKRHELNKLQVKKEREHLEQEEINTEIQRKEIQK
jgi:ABC-type arginine transport system permease subunit